MRKILVLTGTRADFGKLKTILSQLEAEKDFSLHVFVTGMHMLTKYGYTCKEVRDCGYKVIYSYINQNKSDSMDAVLAKTITGVSDYVKETRPDMIIVHGDRVEALAGAIVGGLNNILVAHIEGGEVSGTIDESIRHSVSKLSHLHFVANETAKKRLIQLGEREDCVYVVGSPDIDVMLSHQLPKLKTVKARYEIPFEHYNVLTFHPVTTEIDAIESYADHVVTAVMESGDNYVVISPNNDLGSESIFQAYRRLDGNSSFRVFPSMRFEYFLTLLKYADVILGNSSAGIREAPIYGVPSVNIGTRQHRRVVEPSVLNCGYEVDAILRTLTAAKQLQVETPSFAFGTGGTAEQFISILKRDVLWDMSKQKYFVDY
ncbi:UDP-N-acetylglucosamine 2-epimerase [Motiliproteus sp. MSK22-1]|uniref:UDP-N-acetylglucosamine 2-epimerase n=1 Tax=Motiliproteus sp. MSK22-1 TaxID=1897630 RepID=UPI0018E99545|nr:UDP-N-acetylglucosamine 2-epimerase [Motiliproteus sp. MSK22-1]